MKILSVKADGFKNLKSVSFSPCFGTNIIFGENAQGKTNLIEAIWLASGVKSFRGTKDRDIVDINGDKAEIEIEFENSFRTQNIRFFVSKANIREKTVELNGVRYKTPSKLFGQLSCVVFTPEDLELAKGSPDNRRSFCDLAISQIKRSYRDVITKYENILAQRNTLLKNIQMGISKREDLEVWDVQLSRLGAYISMLRYNYVKKLNAFAQRLYGEISGGREKLTLEYRSTVYEELEGKSDFAGEMADEYMSLLAKTLNEDIRSGFTQSGPHRDDVVSFINGLSSREFGSQGQNRSVALMMKLAQAYILFEETKEEPVMLLDDVLSELDEARQNYIRERIKDFQIFITCCKKPKDKLKNGRLFSVKNGRVEEVK